MTSYSCGVDTITTELFDSSAMILTFSPTLETEASPVFPVDAVLSFFDVVFSVELLLVIVAAVWPGATLACLLGVAAPVKIAFKTSANSTASMCWTR